MGLFDKLKPKHKSNDLLVRREAAKKTNNQKILAKLAMNDDHWMVRREAIPKISDKKVLLYIAKNDDDEICRRMALQKMNESDVPSVLKDEYFEAQRFKKSEKIQAERRRDERERKRKINEPKNRKEGHQCPYCHSYNMSVRSDVGIHCWDCGRDFHHYLKK
ncbi:HEAT repeat domain-containing protein [Methanobrevibacter sp.]|uniref:HEAT repeat domain-containing protein n=1 Tax=Methanobrevibacter sp. TaxID=66852 RepID=UPI00388D63BA